MKYLFKTLSFKTVANKINYFNIKQECLDYVKETGVANGILLVSSPHTTCAVFLEEMVHDFDALNHEYLQRDLNKGLEKIFPKQVNFDDYYKYPGPKHWEFGPSRGVYVAVENPTMLLNGDAHLKSDLIGASLSVPINNEELQTGRLGYIYFVDFDSNRSRERKCNLMIMGE